MTATTINNSPLTGGYPVIAIVTHAGAHGTCGWVLLSSDADGSEILETGVGTTGKPLNAVLASKALVHAEQQLALIRTWRPQLNSAVTDAGGEAYLDVASNIRIDDAAYLHALDIASELAGERAAAREDSEHGSAAVKGPLTIAVDGSRARNGQGGWAWICEDGLWGAGDGEFTSPLHAEVTAISAALHSNPTDRAVHLLCDSRDAIAQVTRALAGERPADTVANSVARVLGIIARNHGGRAITLEWVKGHNGHPLNDRADRLAVLVRRNGGLSEPGALELARSIADLSSVAA